MTEPKKSIMRSLGEFVGHVVKGVRTDVERDRKVLRREVEEETRNTDAGRVTIRRTTIEEVEIDRSTPAADPPGGGTGDQP